MWTGFTWFMLGMVLGSRQRVNLPSGSIKGAKFLDYLSNYWILKDSSPRNHLLHCLVEISGSDGDKYEGGYLLEYCAVQYSRYLPTL
jgi:hypothetical protein